MVTNSVIKQRYVITQKMSIEMRMFCFHVGVKEVDLLVFEYFLLVLLILASDDIFTIGESTPDAKLL